MNKNVTIGLIALVTVAVSVWLTIHFSPFNSCVREFSRTSPGNANATCLQLMSPKQGRAAPQAAAPAAPAAAGAASAPAAAEASAAAPAAAGAAATGAPAAPAAATAAAGDEARRQQVVARLASWARAWRSGDVSTFIAHYDPQFKGTEATRGAWEQQRRQRMTGQKISVGLEDVQVKVDGDKAEVTLIQNYESPTTKDRGRKEMSWVLRNGEWVIAAEKWEKI